MLVSTTNKKIELGRFPVINTQIDEKGPTVKILIYWVCSLWVAFPSSPKKILCMFAILTKYKYNIYLIKNLSLLIASRRCSYKHVSKLSMQRCPRKLINVYIMVLVLYGNSEVGAHVSSNLCYLNCFKSFNQSSFSLKRTIF